MNESEICKIIKRDNCFVHSISFYYGEWWLKECCDHAHIRTVTGEDYRISALRRIIGGITESNSAYAEYGKGCWIVVNEEKQIFR